MLQLYIKGVSTDKPQARLYKELKLMRLNRAALILLKNPEHVQVFVDPGDSTKFFLRGCEPGAPQNYTLSSKYKNCLYVSGIIRDLGWPIIENVDLSIEQQDDMLVVFGPHA